MTRMVTTRFCIVAALLCTFLPAPAQAGCELKQLASVDIEINPNGGVLVPVQINGHDVWLALSMSAGMPMIGPAALSMLQLKTRPVIDREIYSNGVKVRQQVQADSLRIGVADFTDWTLYVQPDQVRPLSYYKGLPLVGTLSSAFMNVVDMELDLAGRKMKLFKQAYCKGAQVYWGAPFTAVRLYTDRSGLQFFPMEVDGKQVETSLNTVGRRTRFDERVTREYYGFQISTAGMATEMLGGPNGPYKVGLRTMSLSAKALGISGLPVSIVPGDRGPNCTAAHRDAGAIGLVGCYGFVPLELGTDVLSRLRLYIASKEERIYFTLAAVPDPAAAAGRSAADPGPDVPAAGGAAAPDAAAPAGGPQSGAAAAIQ